MSRFGDLCGNLPDALVASVRANSLSMRPYKPPIHCSLQCLDDYHLSGDGLSDIFSRTLNSPFWTFELVLCAIDSINCKVRSHDARSGCEDLGMVLGLGFP